MQLNIIKAVLTLSLIAFMPVGFAQTELKGSPEDLRQFLHPQAQLVTLVDRAEKKAYSDKAIIHLVITTEGKTLSESLTQNNTLREKVKADLIAKGISEKDIKNAKFTSTPEYGLFSKKPSTYKVINRISVSIFAEADLRNVALVADSYAEVELAKTEFEHTEKELFEQQIKEEVLKKINKQKEFYEKSLNVKLIPVTFRDARVQRQPSSGARAVSEVEEVIVTGIRASVSDKYAPEIPSEPSFDEVVYTAELVVDYKVINPSAN
ncbi:SIMPL domain-containing protein [Cellvibrio fontiphilus]|uniref:SIMPL domain-containing protein n=1 Tax=Cellvibrio fontiphilus TaxID=1815559 RepID=A0ABV7FB72_9GAMM